MNWLIKQIRFGNSFGLSIAELMVGLGAFAIFMAGSAGIMQMYVEQEQETQSLVWLQDLQYSISMALRDPAAKEKTLLFPANFQTFSCIKNKTDCQGAGGKFTLRLDDALPQAELVGVARSSNPKEGMTYRGTVCNSFDAVNGNDSCPLRYEMSWQALCPKDRNHCLDPQIKVTATLRHEPESNRYLTYVNTEAFEVTNIWQEQADTLKSTCEAVFGTWNGSSCDLPFINKACAPGSFLVGFNDKGELICGQPSPIECPSGQIVTGIEPDGTVICSPGCLSNGNSQQNIGINPGLGGSGSWFGNGVFGGGQ